MKKGIVLFSDEDLATVSQLMFKEMLDNPEWKKWCDQIVEEAQGKFLFYFAWIAGAAYALKDMQQGRLISIEHMSDRGPGG
jgi:hypothetical protein